MREGIKLHPAEFDLDAKSGFRSRRPPSILLEGGIEDGKYHFSRHQAFSSLPPTSYSPTQPCFPVTQMYLENNGEGKRLSCGFTKLDEKNWIPFEKDHLLYMVNSVEPHRVAVVREDGECVLFNIIRLY